MNLLGAMVGWKGYAAAGGVAASLAGLAVYQVTSWRADARYSALVASNAVAMQVYADRATAAEERERTEENRRREEKDRIENETRILSAAAVVDRDRLVVERDRLRASLASYTARQRAVGTGSTAGAIGPGIGSDDAIGVLAGLLDRHTAELTQVGGYADQLRIAGAACERSYDSLTTGKKP